MAAFFFFSISLSDSLGRVADCSGTEVTTFSREDATSTCGSNKSVSHANARGTRRLIAGLDGSSYTSYKSCHEHEYAVMSSAPVASYPA